MTKPKRLPFGERQITVTLTGAQWTALLAKLTNTGLSQSGQEIGKEAERLLAEQIVGQTK